MIVRLLENNNNKFNGLNAFNVALIYEKIEKK